MQRTKGADIERVHTWLRWPPDAIDRLTALTTAALPVAPFSMPDLAEAERILRRLDVPPSVIPEILAATPSTGHQEAWWLLERLYETVLDPAGDLGPPWPAPQEGDDALSRYFHLYVFLAVVPHVLDAHGSRGIPESVTWDTLSDVGLQVAHYQTRKGRGGFDGAFWIWKHFRGNLFRLGRLQYDADHTFLGEPALDIHIPAVGPLTPGSCDASLDRARRFFADHFEETTYRKGVCFSWLLDPQLASYLPGSSNIVGFQRRFTPVEGVSRPGDHDVIRFVFGYLPDDLDALPQETTMQRAAVSHLRSGGHWYIRQGVLAL